MKKIKFNQHILKEYIEYFNIPSLADLIDTITTSKTKETKKTQLKKDLANGEVEVTILKKIAKELKINIYNFFSNEFSENRFLVDFKRKNKQPLNKDTLYILRYYQNLREDIECLAEKGIKKTHFKTADEVRAISQQFREKFKFAEFLKTSPQKPKPADVFKFLREKIEEEGIYVFKNNKGDKEQGNGLDKNLYGCIFLDGNKPPLILINSDYPILSQTSTLLHEFAHYLLGESEIELQENINKNKTEKWCNEFAYHFLLDKETEKKENFSLENKATLIKNIRRLSQTYFISKMSLMIRFKNLGIIQEKELQDFISKPYQEQEEVTKEQSHHTTGGGNYHNTKRERISKRFLAVLSENYSQKKISRSEFSKYAGIKYQAVGEYLV